MQTVDFPVVRPAKSNPDPLAFESFPEIQIFEPKF